MNSIINKKASGKIDSEKFLHIYSIYGNTLKKENKESLYANLLNAKTSLG